MRSILLPLCAVSLAALVGCETNSPNSAASGVDLNNKSQTALQQMTAQDPHLQDMLNNSIGYAIFPEIGQGAVGVGGASGQGVVNRNGQRVGTVKMTQLSIGPDLGGQTYSELIIFQNEKALNQIMNDALEFGAEAHATVVKAGAAAGTQFNNGVAVFILPKGGLEVGASLTGQKFHFTANSGM
ncbi:MAG TPA: YSC84-related protein [Tepidisphaeraceae bacterium]|jgi:lipid-binding SYLF domain-containing protein|nr:YSC84-related protein [Tepidisphaeraceae bacterium]